MQKNTSEIEVTGIFKDRRKEFAAAQAIFSALEQATNANSAFDFADLLDSDF